MMDARLLSERLAPEIAGELRSDAASREMYSRDASLYARTPLAVLRAGAATDLEAAVEACRLTGVPLTMRGAGTSLAGQTVGRGLVVDTSALNEIRIDPAGRRARVGPGAVLGDLNRAAAAHGLIFGADVATADRATLGGMIANNSAGMRSVVHGLTATHVRALTVVMADGRRVRLTAGSAAPSALEDARHLAVRAEPASLLRRVSGYDLGALSEADWPRLLAGTEGTLAVTLEAELDLVPLPAARGIALLGYDSVEEAAAAVPALLRADPSAIEMIDEHLLDPRNRPPADVDLLDFAEGRPGAMLVVEHSGTAAEVADALQAIPGARIVTDPTAQEHIWAARRLGIGRAQAAVTDRAAGRDPRPVPFIEDPAVPPDRLGDFVREARAMLRDEQVLAIWYGHASVGCLHIRPMMDLSRPAEVRQMRRLAEGMAEIVASHDGSLSGEHGDGRARSELLGRMYRPETIAAFGELKRRLDPDGVLNPGVIVDPEPLDSDLAPARDRADPGPAALPFGPEGGLARAATLCSRNGLCRSDSGAMCPSYQALGDERHSTRGRAVIFAAAVEGRLAKGLADPGLREALSLCLSCKACARECPAAVDMSRMKAEALAHDRPKPAQRLSAATPNLLAVAGRAPRAAGVAARIASLGAGRTLPRPAPTWRPPPGANPADVTIMADTFTRHLSPEVGEAAIRVLREAGRRVAVIAPGCCGRTAYSAGMIGLARRRLARTVRALAPAARAGQDIVVLEPSCLSMLTDESGELLPGDDDAAAVRAASASFEDVVRSVGLTAPPAEPLVHVHCHTRALGGAEGAVSACGSGARDSGAGCCGMAGAFGYEHPGLSRRIFAHGLGVAIAAGPAADLVAAGTSCRHQIAELAGVRALHPAEYLSRREA